ncbi:MAG: TetR/AcrR family transcriptional regulator [Gemmatimonadaceae bacterium]|nr:TetR/AcrR family transcriptional regulator [Gemmatimonadaceae bacterium]
MDHVLQATPSPSDGRARILAGALASLRVDGLTGFSLQRASIQAGVSKALVIYHFHTKAALLAAMVEWLTHRVLARERGMMDRDSTTHVLDDLWQYLDAEHEQGEYAILLVLADAGLPGLRDAAARSLEQRRSHAQRSVEGIFQRLQLIPRLPLAHLTEVEQAFREGLLLRMAQGAIATPRAAFDMFWLAVLSQSA